MDGVASGRSLSSPKCWCQHAEAGDDARDCKNPDHFEH